MTRAGIKGSKSEVSDEVPQANAVTPYDLQHATTYLRLLDAEAEGADWREVARLLLGLDPRRDPERAHQVWQDHLARAQWMSEHGYRQLLVRGYH
jgi:hypothetical protein